MPRYLLHHRHEPRECGAAFAAWKGHDSPLRRQETFGTCRAGGHEIWWLVDADTVDEALEQLPWFIAQRSTAAEISAVAIP
jgi:hypothetical protein